MWPFKTSVPKIYYQTTATDRRDLLSQALSAVRDTNPVWLNKPAEGQLAVDVYQTDEAVVIKAAVAGVKAEDLEITVTEDLITVRGRRLDPDEVAPERYFYQECYWGWFSRTVVLPCAIYEARVQASIDDGVLKIVLPKKSYRREV